LTQDASGSSVENWPPMRILDGGSRFREAQELTNLARAALVGSSDDRGRFLDACLQYAYAAAIRFGRKHHGAEDSAQEAAIAIERLLATQPPVLMPDTIGALISVVVLRSVRAAAWRRAREANAAAQTITARHQAPDPALEVETAEWAGRVLNAVDKLPQLLHRIVHLRYWDDLSTREIARELGTSHMTIVRLLKEAEHTLRAELQELDGASDERGDTTPADEEPRP